MDKKLREIRLRKRREKRRLKKFEVKQTSLLELVKQDFINENETAVIEINCQGITDFFELLSCEKRMLLSDEIYQYIERCVYSIPVFYPVILRFVNWSGNDFLENIVRESIQRHYLYILQDKRIDLRFNLIKSFSLFLFGAILLIVSFGMSFIIPDPFGSERFLSIAAIFSLWETVNSFLLERKELKIERSNSGQLAMAEIEFIP